MTDAVLSGVRDVSPDHDVILLCIVSDLIWEPQLWFMFYILSCDNRSSFEAIKI